MFIRPQGEMLSREREKKDILHGVFFFDKRILHGVVGSREIWHLIQMPQNPLSHLSRITIPMMESIHQCCRQQPIL